MVEWLITLTQGHIVITSNNKHKPKVYLKKQKHFLNRFQLMSDVCHSLENLVKCGDKILTHCLQKRNVEDLNEAMLFNLKKVLDGLKVSNTHNK